MNQGTLVIFNVDSIVLKDELLKLFGVYGEIREVEKMGRSAMAISLPFSCILGLFASMTASTLVMRRFVWIYASVQFTLVVFFTHVFYSVVGPFNKSR